jgi:hypothetical protein
MSKVWVEPPKGAVFEDVTTMAVVRLGVYRGEGEVQGWFAEWRECPMSPNQVGGRYRSVMAPTQRQAIEALAAAMKRDEITGEPDADV